MCLKMEVQMNNLEKMKEELVKRIQDMDCNEFEGLKDELLESEVIIDSERFLFTCDKCREKYGECKSEYKDNISAEDCLERFERYCMEEVDD